MNIHTALLDHLAIMGQMGIYLLHVPSGKYRYLSKTIFNITGTERVSLEEVGLQKVMQLTHPDDIAGNIFFNNYLLELLSKLSVEERYGVSCTYDYRLNTARNGMQRYLQQNTFLEFDAEGKPVLKLGIVRNIQHLKRSDVQIGRFIYGKEEEKIISFTPKAQSVQVEDGITQRQKEILLELNAGLSSQQIAEKLNISINTVDNHRRNLLEKLGVMNTTALLSMAMFYGILPMPDGSTGHHSNILKEICRF